MFIDKKSNIQKMRQNEFKLVKKSVTFERLLKKRSVPLTAFFDVTFKCNLKCIHCYADFPHHGKELSFAEAVSVLEQLADLGTLIVVFGGGEPFMRRDFIDIISYARRLGFIVQLSTNATLINKKTADRISELFPYLIKISLYGATEKMYGRTTGNPRFFKSALQGIRLLAERNIPLQVISHAFNFYTIKDILAMKKICQDFGVKWTVSTAITFRLNGDPEPCKYILSASQLVEFARKIPEISVLPFAKNKKMDGLVCDSRGCIYINPYGQIGNCQTLHSKSSMREKSILDIWKNDPLLKKQRKKFIWRDFPDCLKCESRLFCSPCPAINYVATGSLAKVPSAYCQRPHITRQAYAKLYSTTSKAGSKAMKKRCG